jgi:putative MATE family efflux protein
MEDMGVREVIMSQVLEGNLVKNLASFALPIAGASMIQQLFNSADTAVAGRFASTAALAAIGTNAEVVALLVSLSAGLSLGCNVVLSWAIGKHDRQGIQLIMHTSLWLAVAAGLLMAIGGWQMAPWVLRFMNTPEEIFPGALLYLHVYLAGMPFLLVYDFEAAIERSRGNSATPFYILVLSGCCNVLLNLLFVIVFHMDVAGVALATDMSMALSAGILLFVLLRDRDDRFRLSRQHGCWSWQAGADILRTGIPAAVQGAVFCFANIFVQSAVNEFGAAAIAGAAAAMNFEYMAYYLIMAFAQAATTFTGQNQAAGQYGRCRHILWISMGMALAVSVIFCAGITLLGKEASRLYSEDPAVIEASVERMRCILLLTPLCSLYEIPAGVLRGFGHSLLPAVETTLGTCLVRIAWILWFFPRWHTLPMLYIIFPVSWVITTLFVAGTLAVCCRETLWGLRYPECVANSPVSEK